MVRKGYVIRKAINMQKSAKSEILASWCFPRYTTALEDYYNKAHELLDKKGEVRLFRIINISDVGATRVKAHLSSYLDMLKSGQYKVFATNHKAFEYLIVDRQEALFLAPDAVREDLDIGIYGKNTSFVNCLVKLFVELGNEMNMLNIPRTSDDKELMAYIASWVDSQVLHAN
jgi:hypothetical protein